MSPKSNIYCCVPGCTQKGTVDPEGNRVGFFGLRNAQTLPSPPFLFLLSPHAFARLPLGSRFLPLRGSGKDETEKIATQAITFLVYTIDKIPGIFSNYLEPGVQPK